MLYGKTSTLPFLRGSVDAMLAAIRTSVLALLVLALPAQAAKKNKSQKLRSTTPQGPNVVLIVVDDLRDYVGWLGGHPQALTPNMDRLARQGMRFTNAHCNFALCNPSRTSLLTGMLPSSSGVFGNEQDWRRSIQVLGKPTLPECFKAQGYLTAAAGKIFHANHGGPEGRLTGWHGGRRGFELDAAWDQRFPSPGVQIPDLPIHTGQNFNGLNIWHWDWGGIPVQDEQTEDGQVASYASSFLAQKQDHPFFLAVGLYRPHSPWYVPQKYFDALPTASIQLPTVKDNDLEDVPSGAQGHLKNGLHQQIVDKGLWKDAVRAYLASVSFCDAMLGRVLEGLEKGPNANNTIVVFTSDHGWYLGEKQMWHKGGLWEPATRVPLTIYAPGTTKPDSSSAQPVALVDLYPTLCDLAQVPLPAHLDGLSLKPLLTEPTSSRERPAITCSGGGQKAAYAARDARWRYIRRADGSEELYDHQADPHEWNNLATRADLAAEKSRLAAFFPQQFRSAVRPASEVVHEASPTGSIDLVFNIGDELAAAEAPSLKGMGFFIDAAFDFDPAVDGDSTLLSQGDAQSGYILHFEAAQPVLTVFANGQKTTVRGAPVEKGKYSLRASLDRDILALAIPGHSEVLGLAPFHHGFPQEAKLGIAVGQSFGMLKAATHPNSTPFDGRCYRLNLTLLPLMNDVVESKVTSDSPASPIPSQKSIPERRSQQPSQAKKTTVN